jgi:hypoxanthine phosphoribosyltransferase
VLLRARLTAERDLPQDTSMPDLPPTVNPRVYIGRERIQARVRELGAAIERDYPEGSLVLLCILKGSFIFAADLARAIQRPLRIEFLGVQSYGDRTSTSGAVQITQDLTRPIEGDHVVIVEDIVDTGLTSAYLMHQLQLRKPKSVRLCSLLHKPARAERTVTIDYLGFTIDDVFVIGYGLDYAQQYRNLPDICQLDPDAT